MNKLQNINGVQPTRATPGSTGHDVYAMEDGTVPAKGSIKFDSGIAAITESVEVAVDVRSRSGWAWNHDVLAFHGLIDHDYSPNTIGIKLFNLGDEDFCYKAGDRIAQLVFVRCEIDPTCPVVEEVRNGGFGSTNKKSSVS